MKDVKKRQSRQRKKSKVIKDCYAVAILHRVKRKGIKYPIVEYGPTFRCKGKTRVTVEEL